MNNLNNLKNWVSHTTENLIVDVIKIKEIIEPIYNRSLLEKIKEIKKSGFHYYSIEKLKFIIDSIDLIL